MRSNSITKLFIATLSAVFLSHTAHAGDNLEDAQVIILHGTGYSYNYGSDNNTGYTAEDSDPAHLAGGASAWFQFTASEDGFYKFGVDFQYYDEEDEASYGTDFLNGVYTLNEEENLVPVIEGSGRLGFNATHGTTYYLAVDSVEGGYRGIIWVTLQRSAQTQPGSLPIMIYNKRSIFSVQQGDIFYNENGEPQPIVWLKPHTEVLNSYVVRIRSAGAELVVSDRELPQESGPYAVISYWSYTTGSGKNKITHRKFSTKLYQLTNDYDGFTSDIVRYKSGASGVVESATFETNELLSQFSGYGKAQLKKIHPDSSESVWYASKFTSSSNKYYTVIDAAFSQFTQPSGKIQGHPLPGANVKIAQTMTFNAALTKKAASVSSLSLAAGLIEAELIRKNYSRYVEEAEEP